MAVGEREASPMSKGGKISKALKGRSKSESQIVACSPVWEPIIPLAMRDLSPFEIMQITGSKFKPKQVRNALSRSKRPPWHLVKGYSDSIKARERQLSGTKAYQKKRSAGPGEEDKSIVFARALWKAGFFTKDTTQWGELPVLYEKFQGKLPVDTFEKLILEAFLTAVSQAEANLDPTLLNQYRGAMYDVASSSLMRELYAHEQFIKSKICREWWADGEDELGLFSFNPCVPGNKLRRIAQEGEGSYETATSMRRRRAIREMNGNGSKTYRDTYEALRELNCPRLRV